MQMAKRALFSFWISLQNSGDGTKPKSGPHGSYSAQCASRSTLEPRQLTVQFMLGMGTIFLYWLAKALYRSREEQGMGWYEVVVLRGKIMHLTWTNKLDFCFFMLNERTCFLFILNNIWIITSLSMKLNSCAVLWSKVSVLYFKRWYNYE